MTPKAQKKNSVTRSAWTGKKIGKYEIRELIGQGGIGEVYKGFHSALHRDVAIKIIRTHLADKGKTIERFKREAKVVAAMRHPNIVQIYDFDVADETFYMVMEFVAGKSLKEYLAAQQSRGKQLPLEKSLNLFRKVTEAVAYAHKQGVVHRDLKPANILLTPEKEPVLADFGLSKMLGNGQMTALGDIFGTPQYMSPEQAAGQKSDTQTDVYALGIILYELTVGTVPFRGDTPVGIILKHINEPPAPPTSVNPDLPVEIEDVIQKALQKDPIDRYQTAAELLVATETLLEAQIEEATLVDTRFSGPVDDRCPYQGLKTFEEEHAEFYFGREALIQQLVEQMQSLLESNSALGRFMAVLGASGSGKSSLVRAGLIPALRRDAIQSSTHWPIVLIKPGARPLEELAMSVAHAIYDKKDRLDAARKLLDSLTADGRALHLAIRLALDDAPEDRKLLLVVDQFEETFTLCNDEAEQQRFISNLLYASALSAGRVVVLITMRADFYHRCTANRDLANRCSAQQTLVGPMDETELRRAIERPAQKVGLRFQPGLVETILSDVSHQPGALPLLQHALLELWQKRQGRMLTLSAYRDCGGVSGAIAQRADKLYASLKENEKDQVRRIMLRLTELGQEGTPATSRRASQEEFATSTNGDSVADNVIKTLADARLITVNENSVEVAHEALIREWPTLQHWLEKDREGLLIHRHLAQAAHEWHSSGQDDAELYRGARLATATEWAEDHEKALNPQEQDFLKASQQFASRVQAEKEERRRREVAQAQALAKAERARADLQVKSKKRFRSIASVLAVLFVLSAIITWVAIREQRILDARRLAFAASSLLDTAPETALLLAYDAVSRRHDFRTEQALRGALQDYTWKALSMSGHDDHLRLALFSPDGNTILTASEDGTAKLWDLDGAPVATLTGHEAGLLDARFSMDGTKILTGSRDGTARLWNLQGQVATVFDGHDDEVESAVFSPDGKTVLTASEDKTAKLWDLDGRELAVFAGHDSQLQGASFSPNGQRVLTASEDGTARLWNLKGRELVAFRGHKGEVIFALFSPDGKLVLTGSDDHTARLWRPDGTQLVVMPHSEGISCIRFGPSGKFIFTSAGRENTVHMWNRSGQLLNTFRGHTRHIERIEFSADKKLMLTASRDGTARMWKLSGEPVYSFKGHLGDVHSAVFSPTREQVLTASYDGVARLWQRVGEITPALIGHKHEVEFATYSPSGTSILTASTDATARLWDLQGHELVVFEGHTEQIERALFSPDEQYVITASEDGTARLWEIGGRQIAVLAHEDQVSTAVFSPDGQLIVTASNDHTASLWNLEGKRLAVLRGHSGELQSAEFSPDGKYVLTAAEDSTARLWNLQGESLRTFVGHANYLQEACFSPDGNSVLTSSKDHTARLWDLQGQVMATLVGHGAQVEHILFNKAGDRILTTSFDNTARLWDLDGETIAIFKGHTNVIKWAEFSPDGRLVVTASDDGSARIWNLDGSARSVLLGHQNWVASARFSPDGTRVVTASRDNAARQFVVNVGDLQAAAACLVSRELNPDEIERFAVGKPHFKFADRQCPPEFGWETTQTTFTNSVR